jgi:phosphatidylserine decarboxylase
MNMKIDWAGIPFIAGAAAVGGLFAFLDLWMPGAAFWVLAAGFTFFFRDPDRRAPSDAGLDAVLAPADGRILHAGPADPGAAPEGTWQQVSIFLSPLDVHVNRTPVGGRVVEVSHSPGRFLPAYDRRSGAENERSEIRVDHAGQTVIFRQVVGVLARRVVCRLVPGMHVERGQRFGIMKFGSRMDVFLPESAALAVAVGESVRGGETVLARLAGGREPRS